MIGDVAVEPNKSSTHAHDTNMDENLLADTSVGATELAQPFSSLRTTAGSHPSWVLFATPSKISGLQEITLAEVLH